MKAVILAAGNGTRMRPLTNNKPKPLLPVAGKPIMEYMIAHLLGAGISDFAIVTGYLEDKIRDFVTSRFPSLSVTFISNKKHRITNTGYSLLLTRPYVEGSPFIKCDGDVVFELEVVKKLINSSVPNALCIDRTIDLAAEEVKVTTGRNGRVSEVSKKLDPAKAAGESIGIERLSAESGAVLFKELARLMRDKKNYQEYYDDSYTTLVQNGVPFYTVDITGLKWVEIDNLSDYAHAQLLFQKTKKGVWPKLGSVLKKVGLDPKPLRLSIADSLLAKK